MSGTLTVHSYFFSMNLNIEYKFIDCILWILVPTVFPDSWWHLLTSRSQMCSSSFSSLHLATNFYWCYKLKQAVVPHVSIQNSLSFTKWVQHTSYIFLSFSHFPFPLSILPFPFLLSLHPFLLPFSFFSLSLSVCPLSPFSMSLSLPPS